MSNELSVLAHDLRTPLTALKLATGMLAARRSGVADPEERELIELLERNVARLEGIAEQLGRLSPEERLCERSAGST